MAISKAKRKEMETLIYTVFDALDPSKTNSSKYRDMFKKLSDQQFDSFFRELFKNDDQYLILDTVDYENDLKIEYIQKACNLLGVELFEYIAMPFINGSAEDPVVSAYPIPNGYAHIKRMQQTLAKKNSTSIEISQRSPLTGQVTRDDKNTRDSDVENFSWATLDADDVLRELNGPRADDMVMKTQMYQQISKNGFTSLNTLESDVFNKTTLNTVDVFYIGSGLKTDLVTDGMLVRTK